ncbi:MAG TPA: hybrid sensor histidine kinase/response regulator [Syntrophobacteraceae bacterium]|nr:hybrid sensor histidine kinase/response regulator [Syntrophobacteraceae bacterium]
MVVDVEVVASPVTDQGERAILVLLRDITERKQAEEALRASEEKYRLVVENAHDAIFIAQDGCIKFPNRRLAVLSGYSLEELTQIPFLESVHPEDRDLVAAMHHGRIRGEEVPTTYSFRVMSKSGETSWVELSSVLISWEGKAASLNFLRDITVQRKLESQLRQAQKMEAIGTLAGGIAHDFNNILSAIMGYAELLTLFHIEKDNPARPNLEEVLIATHRAKDLVQQILAFSRQTEQEKRPVLLAPIIKEALKFLRASLPTTIEIRHFMPSPIDSVWADPTQMHQVIMNLCTNAAHAMKERGGLLEIRLERMELGLQARERFHDLAPGPYVRLAVTDTGLGMSREIMERIFDPYFTTKKLGEGTGLGLAVVHGIIKNHGGLIGVDSELGKGTTFEVLLPRLKGEEPTSAEKTEKRLPVGTECILFVDDEQSIVDIGRGILERLGYEVVGETNPSVALETFEAHPQRFHLVVTDLTMPHMTGLQLAEKLILMRADIPIILCTGLGDQSAKKEAKAIGIKKFVHKPISVYKLADTVREILNERLQEFPRSTWPTS